MKLKLLISALLLSVTLVACQEDEFVYKDFGEQGSLSIRIFPGVERNTKDSPAVILLSGGGWIDFAWTQFNSVGEALVAEGAKVFVVEYRVSKTFPMATPIDALEDVQDAVIYLRKNAKKFGIVKNQIITIGASVGGQMAFASSLSNHRNLSAKKNMKPNFIIAYSPVLRNDKEGYAFERIGQENQWFSPWNVYANSDARIPPALVFSGDQDHLIKLTHLKQMQDMAKAKGDIFELHVFEGVGHSIIKQIPDIYTSTAPAIIDFLKTQGVKF